MSLKLLVNEPKLWMAFNEELDENIRLAQKDLETLTDLVKVYQAQGSIKAFRKLKTLREKVNGGPNQKSLFE
jgi:hypothetical protein